MCLHRSLAIWMVFLFPIAAFAQSEQEKEALRSDLVKFEAELSKVPDSLRTPDLAICGKAVDWLLRHDEFFKPDYLKKGQRTLEIGRKRIAAVLSGTPDWGKTPGVHALAYQSRIDGSLQPYLLKLPAGYKSGEAKRRPLYVVLHGRNANLTEASFIADGDGKPAPKDQDWIELEVYGRGNNAYRWAGETDVFEAMADVIRRCKIDERRITLWGFSMGGAGAWHLAVHHPSQWASAGAGAGFIDYYKYQKKTEHLPDHQHRPLNIYDADKYALNLGLVPMIGYGGENDPQLAASQTMKAEADKLGVPLESLVGPGMGHKFDDASLKTFMAFLAKHNAAGRPVFPGRREFQFVTYTLKYPRCEWLTIHEMATPYERTTVSSKPNAAGELELTTENVSALSVARGAADAIRIDGSNPFALSDAAGGNLPDVYFVLDADGWRLLDYDDSLEFEKNPEMNKRPGLQGPIDDAFMEPFVCVRPTGTPWSPNLKLYADWSLDRFTREHDKWLRGKVPVVNDRDLTDDQLRDRNLILFGDPGSNAVLARIVKSLPLRWTRDEIELQGKSWSTKDHAVVLVYPNPDNPEKYVVINSGMTTRESDFKGTNALLFPKLGDYAVIRFESKNNNWVETVESAGIFNSHWEFAE